MKKIGLMTAAAALVAASCGVANAADLPTRAAPITKAPPLPIMYNWSGFYIGANGGYGWSRQCIDITGFTGLLGTAAVFGEGCKNAGGGVIGGQVGYRWQFGQTVFGLEAQGDWANLRNTRVSNNPNLLADTWRSQLNGLGLFTGQLGYAFNEVLFYGKGGAAVGSQNFGLYNTLTGNGIAYASRTRWGGVVGLGMEYGFAPNWSAGIEWDYLWRVSDTTTWLTPALSPAITAINTNTKTDVNLLTLRVNYKFGAY